MTKLALTIPLLFSLTLVLPAQESEEEAPAGREAPQAHVRAWIFNSQGPARLSLRGENKEEAITLAEVQGGGGNINVEYRPLAPGRYLLELSREEQILASEPILLGKDSIHSIVAWPEAGKWRLKLFGDNSAPNATDKPLRLLHFNPQVGLRLAIDAGPEQEVPLGTVTEKKITAKGTVLHLTVASSDAKHKASSYFEADFITWPSAYAFAQADYRGRIKPTIIQGGITAENEAASE